MIPSTYQQEVRRYHRRVHVNELIRTLAEITLVAVISYAVFVMAFSWGPM